MKKYIIFLIIGVVLLGIFILILLFGIKKQNIELSPSTPSDTSQQSLPRALPGISTLNQQEQQEQALLKRVFAQSFGGESNGLEMSKIAIVNDAAMGSWQAGDLGGTLVAKKINGEWKYLGGDGGQYYPYALLREFGITMEEGRELLDILSPDWRSFVSIELQ
ncbi:MAG: hypothetical protein A3H59_00345 [Candidatus Jacksonbacteria bacterium RIFCSPLOWO2_02_FULL_43_9]|nr:MAG: hypothetical protein UV70_C0002G0002 [Parcubacteria group bacterium GW2011_GWA2_43_13]OGY70000.1 MAG: hypothetical protein A3B94_03460 [Candidatus Jacksonbacteria bacterium RIFCSPHIGHO2_02_FULL_43_10]OGY71078.1 MAG: hypothetical protein A2986_01240 [Candidatus Jacksonbacteria bacterium RIFCSPLOWO2_01_FULL_44_13]OGY73036.1 MAG: hypothetical protein A3H59_00345 [Candidatus Jacksonbacteria bacterium RIFCSPLOWO2_02_FULL_43_9]HAZ16457.1 hypothetical protein [Candidatus Jacksonbacteria bacter